MTTATNGVHHATDESIDLLYAWMPPQAPAQPCPEAVFSLTLKGKLGGQEALLTARGQTAAEFRRNLEAIKGLLDPVPQPSTPQAASSGQGAEGWCVIHNGAMRFNEGKDGRKGWFSHRLGDGTWCKGR
jgi:hypothetical protein